MNAGNDITTANAAWTFAGETAKNFNPHIERSVPLYKEGHDLVVELSDFFLSDKSICYDLGCSTGTLVKRIAERNEHKHCGFIGIDCEKDMTLIASQTCRDNENIRIINDDIVNVEIENADMVVSYYTMQFVKPKVRQLMFDKIYQGLNWGGAFIFFEKVRASDARFQDILSTLYLDYKLNQGFQPDEIIAKTKSLKGVLEPFSTQGNIDLMKRAGFTDIISVMKYVCFEGFLAIK